VLESDGPSSTLSAQGATNTSDGVSAQTGSHRGSVEDEQQPEHAATSTPGLLLSASLAAVNVDSPGASPATLRLGRDMKNAPEAQLQGEALLSIEVQMWHCWQHTCHGMLSSCLACMSGSNHN
jgi:hypothetical protein